MLDQPFLHDTGAVTARGSDARMMVGFGNHFATEAVAGALPESRNSPQHVPFGLYTEQMSGTAFTAPRSENRRSWLYRLRPTANHGAYVPFSRETLLRSAPFNEVPPSPNRMRWDPMPLPDHETMTFLDGLVTYGGNGDVGRRHSGVAVHGFTANTSMQPRHSITPMASC